MTVEVPRGSVWYAWGHHWKVTGQGVKDGEDAVHLSCTSCDRNAVYKHPTVAVHRLVRYGERREEA
jgi:hypothetical protein